MIDLEKIKCPTGESLDWYGCYEREIRFKKYLHPDTFAHPAKMSLPLADRIFKHLKKLGLIKEGDTVIDFMAGSSRTGIIASMHDCKFIGVELEPHFVEMSEKNRLQLEKKLGQKVDWQIIQGDSRKLSEILNEGGAGIVSPPYSEAMSGGGINKKGYKGKYGEDPNMVDRIWSKENLTAQRKRIMNGKAKMQRPDAIMNETNIAAKGYFEASYSSNPSNIGNLPDKPLVGITSPPYGDIEKRDRSKEKHWDEQREIEKSGGTVKISKGYQASDKNIGHLSDKPLVGVVSPLSNRNIYIPLIDGLLKNEQPSYLSEMYKVYSEAFRSGISPLVIVTKNSTCEGALKRLDLSTAFLLERVGYEIIDYHRAILFTEHEQQTLTNSTIKKPKGRLSFFKRLSWAKGSPVAQWEDILFAMMPKSGDDRK